MVEVAVGNGGDVAAAEDSDFEILGLGKAVFAGDLGAGALEVVEGLVDDFFGANVAGNGVGVAVVGDQFGGRGQVDTVDVGVSVKS